MSDSRLEKFIYAICSMDVSDLPVPLSRIETLWNCLITGETPDFEPLSRNEKYLMAMLDRYDISNLPAPMSRGEKLLYKIAVGETDLSDVPVYLSRYEELLKYLIENGGISGGDFEYVLYTLNQSLYTLYTTAEKPVKSAILRGCTLINMNSKNQILAYCQHDTFTQIQDDNYVTVTVPSISVPQSSSVVRHETSYGFIEGKTYTIISDDSCVPIDLIYNGGAILSPKSYRFAFVAPKNMAHIDIYYRKYADVGSSVTYKFPKKVVILEGDYTNADLPYFEGMTSVKMPVLTTTGKNLFNINDVEEGGTNWSDGTDSSTGMLRVKRDKLIAVKPNTTYVFNKNNWTVISYYDKNKESVGGYAHPTNTVFTTPANCYYLRFRNYKDYGSVEEAWEYLEDLQLEEGSTASSFEPHKSNILSCNEEVVLRGIGDVKDEMNLLTGELTERIDEIVLDGSKVYYPGGNSNDNYLEFIVRMNNAKRASALCDKVFTPSGGHKNNTEYVRVTESGIIGYILKTRLSTPDVDGLKAWLSSNNVTVQYQLATPITKSIDISTVDQDNQPTQLGTFENLTHVSLEAENLIPEVEMEVATNLLEDTVFNLTNAFNTLYPTAAKPVKSAILKGNTLVNLFEKPITSEFVSIPVSTTSSMQLNLGRTDNLKPNTTYSFIYNLKDVKGITEPVLNLMSSTASPDVRLIINNGYNVKTFTTPSDYNGTGHTFRLYYQRATDGESNSAMIANTILLEGDYTGIQIPFFTGMQSVKMPVLTTTGKNLTSSIKHTERYNKGYLLSDKIKVKKGEQYQASFRLKCNDTTGEYRVFFRNYNTVDTYINGVLIIPTNEYATYNLSITTRSDGYICLWSLKNNDMFDVDYVQIEQGTVATSYEPYKTNILTVNEPIELRGIGDVRDTLDCLTGEVTERIGEIMLDGSEGVWSRHSGLSTDECDVYWTFNGFIPSVGKKMLSDKLGYSNPTTPNTFRINDSGGIFIGVSKGVNINDYLSQNTPKIQYDLSQSIIKTVDLTIVDQDNQPTQLGTFENLTHVSLESEGLIPTAVLTVRTKNPSASSTSLLIDDISTKQERLNTTIDEQSENVDATMIATTEIFEETL